MNSEGVNPSTRAVLPAGIPVTEMAFGERKATSRARRSLYGQSLVEDDPGIVRASSDANDVAGARGCDRRRDVGEVHAGSRLPG